MEDGSESLRVQTDIALVPSLTFGMLQLPKNVYATKPSHSL